MRVVVTGGTGVVSRGVVAELCAAGHEVTCLLRGASEEPARARVVHADRQAYSEFVALVRGLRPEALIDMLCFSALDARCAVAACGPGTHYMLCSTVCVYGHGDGAPVRETDARRPVKPYGRGKVAAEDVVLRAADERGILVTVIRPSTVYGPGGWLPRQVADDWYWPDRVRAGRPVLVVDGGRARHQFLHSGDVGRAVTGLLGRPPDGARVVNLVGEAITWRAYHQLVSRTLTGADANLVSADLADLLACDPVRFDECDELSGHDVVFDGTALAAELPGWRPATPLPDGIAELAAHLSEHGPPGPGPDWEDWVLAGLHGAGRC